MALQARPHEKSRDASPASDPTAPDGPGLPSLSPEVGREDAPALYPVEGMQGGFKYWWDSAASGLRLITESWSGAVDGSGQLHEITPEGTRLLGEGFV